MVRSNIAKTWLMAWRTPPQAFIGLLEGKNFGKLVIRVTKD